MIDNQPMSFRLEAALMAALDNNKWVNDADYYNDDVGPSDDQFISYITFTTTDGAKWDLLLREHKNDRK